MWKFAFLVCHKGATRSHHCADSETRGSLHTHPAHGAAIAVLSAASSCLRSFGEKLCQARVPGRHQSQLLQLQEGIHKSVALHIHLPSCSVLASLDIASRGGPRVRAQAEGAARWLKSLYTEHKREADAEIRPSWLMRGPVQRSHLIFQVQGVWRAWLSCQGSTAVFQCLLEAALLQLARGSLCEDESSQPAAAAAPDALQRPAAPLFTCLEISCTSSCR